MRSRLRERCRRYADGRRVASLAVLVASTLLVVALATSSAAAASPEPTPTQLQGELHEVQQQNDDLESFFTLLLVPVTILVGLLASGGALGLVTSFRSERRQGESHRLAVAGETASQQRAAQSHLAFLTGSQQTLNLVNDTLLLAKQASERAAEAMEEKARERLRELDREARDVIEDTYKERDFKQVVQNAFVRDQLADIARNLGSIEGFVGMHGLELTPHLLFVKGFERHIASASRRAIETWREAAAPGEDPDLSALSLFWAGYESNNIGDFRRAADSFTQARDRYLTDADLAQHHELERNQIQARFFELADEESSTQDRRPRIQRFVEEIEVLIETLQGSRRDFAEERRRCEETLGELLLWGARISPLERAADHPPDEDERACLEAATRHFEAGGDHIWSRFGLAQVRWVLGQGIPEADYRVLLQDLIAQADLHREPRTLALRRAAVLIVEGEHGESAERLDRAHHYLWDAIGHTGGGLTIFSPWQKRNVSHETFQLEVETFYERVRAESKD
jgi:tetratricopeptide (TPR) repeat protein